MIIAADLHLGLTSDSVASVDGFPSKVAVTLDRLRALLAAASKENDLSLIIAGDIFDSANPPSWAHARLLSEISNYPDVHVFLIPGNHDCSGFSASTDVAYYYGRNVIASPRFYFHSHTRSEVISCFLPHYSKEQMAAQKLPKKSWEDFLAAEVKDIRADYPKKLVILIAHGSLSSAASLGEEQRMEATGNAMVFDPVRLGKIFDYTFIGHIHKPQRLGKIYIPGSVVMNDFAEVGEKKGYYRFDGETVKFVAFKKSAFEYCELSLDISKGGALPSSLEIAKLLKGTLVKVKLKVKDRMQVERKAIYALVERTGARICRFELDIAKPGRRAVSVESRNTVHKGLDHVALLKAYLGKSKEPQSLKLQALSLGRKVIGT